MPSVLVLQHEACETLGTIEGALMQRGIAAQTIASYAGELVPRQIGEAAGLIVLGGPMGVYEQEQYPFLHQEMHLIGNALAQNMPVLGVCLGAQLLAHTLGAAVAKARQPEIGWYPLFLTEEARRDQLWAGIASPCMAFHWHGDAFALPAGAVALASSALTPCQAFRFGDNNYGLQCHLEVTTSLIENWTVLFGAELQNAGLIPEEIQTQAITELPQMQRTAQAVFGTWANLLPGSIKAST